MDIDIEPVRIIHALQALLPKALCSVRGDTYEDIVWEDEREIPTKEDVESKLAELKVEHAAQEYARNRAAEYPGWDKQLEKIYDDGLTKWKSEMVDPVKTKWPKDNSGPV